MRAINAFLDASPMIDADVAHSLARQLDSELWMGRDWEAPGARDAAVLIPLIRRQEGYHILLTKRADHLSSHAGQVSFPGGKVEDHDANNIATALRETFEETGIAASHVKVIGSLGSFITGTGYRVEPIIGLVDGGFQLEIEREEVEIVFEVPLPIFMDQENYTIETFNLKGRDRRYHAICYDGFNIWGLTAAILVNLRHVLMHYSR
jgi:8-oxo-dGTP pyrophosphatase MutT (NUDIX family)